MDALEGAPVERRPRWRTLLSKFGRPPLALAVVLLVWQVLIWAEIKPRYTFPSPLDVGTTLVDQWRAGTLGLSPATIYFVVLLGAVPSIANGTISGIDQVPPLYPRVGRVLGARGLRAARYVIMPAALPGYLGRLKQGWAFSWRSLMPG